MNIIKNNKNVLIASFIIIIISFGIYMYLNEDKTKENVAVLSVSGNVVKTFDLNTAKDEIIDLYPFTSINAKVSIKDHKIRFLDVDCEDKICEKAGFISSKNQSAVCLPNKMAMKIQ